MDSRKQTAKPPRHGVAMFVVLGVIVVISMLGFVGLQLAKSDSDQSGNSADMKSQRMTAIGGLNMAVARMQKSDADLVTLINAFNASAGTGAVKEWLDFGGSSITVTSSDPGYTPLGGDANSGYKVHILGIEAISTASTLDITLEAFGRGRSGDVHAAVATYRMSGLNSRLSTNSIGPTNALLSTGGFASDGFNQTVTIDGGVYSGGNSSTGELRLQASGASSTTRIRTNGNVRLNSSITIAENSIIGGYLDVNGGNATFEKNLLLRGNLMLNNALTVKGSMIFSGSTLAGYRNGSINVTKDLLVDGARFEIEKDLTVGVAGSTSSRAWFNSGINISQTGSRTINGSMYIKNTDGLEDGLSNFTIKQDLRYEGTSGFGGVLRLNTTRVDRDVYANRAIKGGGNGDGLSVGGRSVLLNGISDNNGQSHTFGGDVYLKSTNQAGLNGSFTFNGTLSMNGTIALGWENQWKFGTGPKTWSYTSTNNCTYQRPISQVQNASDRSCRPGEENEPSWVAITPTPITESSLGYTTQDLDIDPLSNANKSSDVLLNKFPAGFLDAAQWTNMKSDINYSTCNTSSINRPTAGQISCIYNIERSRYLANKSSYSGPLYQGTDGLHTFLVINITNDWSMGGAPSGSDLVIPKGVHVMFIINATQSNSGNWYTNAQGSTQIIYIQKNPGAFGWDGTVYGFVQFNVPNQSQLQTTGNMVLYGALESAQQSTKLQPNSGSLKVSINDDKAKTVKDNIVMSFTGTSTGSDNDIIRFNGDQGRTITTTRVLTTNDGWVQFERLGEFR